VSEYGGYYQARRARFARWARSFLTPPLVVTVEVVEADPERRQALVAVTSAGCTSLHTVTPEEGNPDA
jgi:hypothetical protein